MASGSSRISFVPWDRHVIVLVEVEALVDEEGRQLGRPSDFAPVHLVEVARAYAFREIAGLERPYFTREQIGTAALLLQLSLDDEGV